MDKQTLPLNQNYAVWGLTGTLIWGFVISLFFIATQIIVMAFFIFINYGVVNWSIFRRLVYELQYNGIMLSITTFATTLVCTILIIVAIKLKKNSNIKHYLGLKTVDFKTAIFWFLVVACLLFVTDLLTYTLDKPIVTDFMLTLYKDTKPLWILLLALVIAAPISEELFFRGFLLKGLSSTFLKPTGAVIISAALWASIHFQYDLYWTITIFATGLVLGVARIKSGSTMLTIGLHSFANLVAFVEVFVSLQ